MKKEYPVFSRRAQLGKIAFAHLHELAFLRASEERKK
jgi:hypothetical protein